MLSPTGATELLRASRASCTQGGNRHLGPPSASGVRCVFGRGGCHARTRSPLSHGAPPVAASCVHGVGPDRNLTDDPRVEQGEDAGLSHWAQTRVPHIDHRPAPVPMKTHYDPGRREQQANAARGALLKLLLKRTGFVTSQQTLGLPLRLPSPGHPRLTEKATTCVRSHGAVAGGSAWVPVRARAHSQLATSC